MQPQKHRQSEEQPDGPRGPEPYGPSGHGDHAEHHEGRRHFVLAGLAVLGLVAAAKLAPVAVRKVGEIAGAGSMPRMIQEVDRGTLHRPQEHYTRLEVWRQRLIFRKSCCAELELKGAWINGRGVPATILKDRPLEVELPEASGKVELDVRVGREIVRYTFQV